MTTDLLLDTNVLLWFLEKNARLTAEALKAIATAPQAYVSTVSIWEIAIKRRLGKLKTPEDLIEKIAEKGFSELRPSFMHALGTETLPPIHADPFDRMLIAQAKAENLTLVTGDRHIPRYDVKTLVT